MDAVVWLLQPVAEQHQNELRQQALDRRRHGSARRRTGRRPGSRRERLGWALVELGLRLALPAGERPRVLGTR